MIYADQNEFNSAERGKDVQNYVLRKIYIFNVNRGSGNRS